MLNTMTLSFCSCHLQKALIQNLSHVNSMKQVGQINLLKPLKLVNMMQIGSLVKLSTS